MSVLPSDLTVVPADAPARAWYASRQLWLVLVAQTAFSFGWSTYLIHPKFFATVLHADARTLGIVGTVASLTSVATIPLVAALVDRVGRRPLFRAGVSILLLASIGYSLVDHVGPLVFLAHAGVGASFVLAYNSSVTAVTDEVPPDRVGHAIGILGAAQMSMNAVSVAVAESLAARLGWRVVFGVAAAAALLALLLSLALRETARPALGAPSGRERWLPPLRGGLGHALLASALTGAPFVALFSFHQPFALQRGASEVAGFFLGFTVTAILLRVVFGSLGDRLGRRRVSAVALSGYALVALAAIDLQPSYLWAYGAAFGIAHGVLYPTLNAYAIESAPPWARGQVIAFFNGAFNVGGGLAAFLWGQVADRAGFPTLFALAAIIALLGSWLLVSGQAPSRGPGVGAL